jgi:hypothetical protein
MCSGVQQSSEKEYFTAPTAGTDCTGGLLQQNQGEDLGSVEQVGQGRGSVHETRQEEVSKAQVRAHSLLPKASLWICQSQVFWLLLRWHTGKIRNRSNLQRTTWRCQINAPFQLSVDVIKLRLWICKEKCEYFQKHGKQHKQQHLNQCLEAAQDWEDELAKHQILATIKWEKDRAFWQWLNYALGKHIHG